MKHENDMSNMVGFLKVVRLYSFLKEIKLSTNVFLLGKLETTNFIKEIKHVLCAIISLVKTSAKSVRILEQVKTLECVSSFHWFALDKMT